HTAQLPGGGCGLPAANGAAGLRSSRGRAGRGRLLPGPALWETGPHVRRRPLRHVPPAGVERLRRSAEGSPRLPADSRASANRRRPVGPQPPAGDPVADHRQMAAGLPAQRVGRAAADLVVRVGPPAGSPLLDVEPLGMFLGILGGGFASYLLVSMTL